jgi:hypothetical protein
MDNAIVVIVNSVVKWQVCFFASIVVCTYVAYLIQFLAFKNIKMMYLAVHM